mmetsp:Transcript_52029/g.106040  ORF Transcript_52029/g.106040 Transcript_52029/m.106040 type:complete len:213 (-) Transcript_52029:65-703(-)
MWDQLCTATKVEQTPSHSEDTPWGSDSILNFGKLFQNCCEPISTSRTSMREIQTPLQKREVKIKATIDLENIKPQYPQIQASQEYSKQLAEAEQTQPKQKRKEYNWDKNAERLRVSRKLSLQDNRVRNQSLNKVHEWQKRNSVAEEFELRKTQICTEETHQALKDRVGQISIDQSKSRENYNVRNNAGVMYVKTGSKSRFGDCTLLVRGKTI